MFDPFPPGIDYFTAMDLARKLEIDRQELERRYQNLSRRFYPDFFQTASPHERVVSLENSALINKASRTLRDPLMGKGLEDVAEDRALLPYRLSDEHHEVVRIVMDARK